MIQLKVFKGNRQFLIQLRGSRVEAIPISSTTMKGLDLLGLFFYVPSSSVVCTVNSSFQQGKLHEKQDGTQEKSQTYLHVNFVSYSIHHWSFNRDNRTIFAFVVNSLKQVQIPSYTLLSYFPRLPRFAGHLVNAILHSPTGKSCMKPLKFSAYSINSWHTLRSPGLLYILCKFDLNFLYAVISSRVKSTADDSSLFHK